MNAIDFARALIDSGDLDPIYVMLHGSDLSWPALRRWCLAYWLFYHAGTASRLCTGPEGGFWTRVVADLDNWPRGNERRHYRGAAARQSVAWLAGRFAGPGAALDTLASPAAVAVMATVRTWRGFGDWIAFKVADMLDRCLGLPLDWSGAESVLYREPRAGCALVAAEHGLPDDPATVMAFLLDRLGDLKAPPAFDRRLSLPEIETLLCKYKAHTNGRYPIGKDIREVRHALEAFPSDLSRQLARCLPTAPSTCVVTLPGGGRNFGTRESASPARRARRPKG